MSSCIDFPDAFKSTGNNGYYVESVRHFGTIHGTEDGAGMGGFKWYFDLNFAFSVNKLLLHNIIF